MLVASCACNRRRPAFQIHIVLQSSFRRDCTTFVFLPLHDIQTIRLLVVWPFEQFFLYQHLLTLVKLASRQILNDRSTSTKRVRHDKFYRLLYSTELIHLLEISCWKSWRGGQVIDLDSPFFISMIEFFSFSTAPHGVREVIFENDIILGHWPVYSMVLLTLAQIPNNIYERSI